MKKSPTRAMQYCSLFPRNGQHGSRDWNTEVERTCTCYALQYPQCPTLLDLAFKSQRSW